MERPEHGGDILVETLADLEGAKRRRRRERGDGQSPHEFARSPILLAIGDEKILQRQFARAVSLAQLDAPAKRDQTGREVANRRPVGDAAADRARGAHLRGTKTAHDLAKVGVNGRERGRGLVQPDARHQRETFHATIHRVEASDAAGPDDLARIAQSLRDPEADIGRARYDQSVRMIGVKRGKGVLARRRGEKGMGVANHDVDAIGQRLDRHASAFFGAIELILHRRGANLQRGVDDGPITRATTEIARELIADIVARHGARAIVLKREQAHHDAGRAEPALGRVVANHRVLQGMWRRAVSQILDGQYLGAIGLSQQQDAGIDRFMNQLSFANAGQHDGAGAAIALGAPFLGSGRALLHAQPVQQRLPRRRVEDLDGRATKDEPDRRTARHR